MKSVALALGLFACIVATAFADIAPHHIDAREAISFAKRKIEIEWRSAGIPGNGRTLSCQVVFSIAADGSLIETGVHQSSGNDAFDKSCLAAIAAAAPFPEVADALKTWTLPIKIRLTFRENEPAEPGATDNPDAAQ